MKTYIFISDHCFDDLSRRIDSYIKIGFQFEDWKISNNNAIIVLLSREQTEELCDKD